MYPNPQDVLPLPPRPSLEHYRKRAKDLVKACKSSDRDAIRDWAARWIDALASLGTETGWRESRGAIDRYVEQLAQFATAKLTSADHSHAQCALTDAQFVIARVHGFQSWPKFAKHLDALGRTSSVESAFEAAANAIIGGETDALVRLLRENPELIRARSTREHRGTLLHYVAANGVENYRQRTPRNAVEIATILLDAGADVDAGADMYGGGATTLGLVATSVHPDRAGVQNALIDLLLTRGARLDEGAVNACLANGRAAAGEHLAALGARLDLEAAAGVGRLDLVMQLLEGKPTPGQLQRAFSTACSYGRREVVEMLLRQGVDVSSRLRGHGAGHTGLHVAAYGGHVEVVGTLVERGASVDVVDDTWGTTPLVWALHAWSNEPAAPPERYRDVVRVLVAAGAVVPPGLLDDPTVRADSKMLEALRS